MSAMKDTALAFFDACESGKGWNACRAFCHDNATFSAQADALAGVDTLHAYAEWMKGMYTPAPNASYEIRSFAVDEERGNAIGYGVFRATHTDDGGPVPPTGKSVEAEYVYIMDFDGDRISHMTKVWNDGHSLKQIGWA
ncbi:MAG: nuclear transport factor 2 family protein [Planctomycetota bacterium]